MRGCAGSSVADSSAICRSTRTRCSTRRGTSCDFCTSGSVSPAPRSMHLAGRPGARLGLGARGGGLGQLGRQLAQLLLVEAGLVAPAVEDVGLAAKARHLRLGLRHLLGELLDLRPELGARILALEHRAQGEIVAVELGQLVGDVGGEPGVLGPELDHDAARILDLVDAQRIVVGGEHAVLLALAGAGPDQADRLQQLAEEPALDQRAVELGLGGEAAARPPA